MRFEFAGKRMGCGRRGVSQRGGNARGGRGRKNDQDGCSVCLGARSHHQFHRIEHLPPSPGVILYHPLTYSIVPHLGRAGNHGVPSRLSFSRLANLECLTLYNNENGTPKWYMSVTYPHTRVPAIYLSIDRAQHNSPVRGYLMSVIHPISLFYPSRAGLEWHPLN